MNKQQTSILTKNLCRPSNPSVNIFIHGASLETSVYRNYQCHIHRDVLHPSRKGMDNKRRCKVLQMSGPSHRTQQALLRPLSQALLFGRPYQRLGFRAKDHHVNKQTSTHKKSARRTFLSRVLRE